MMRLAVLLTSSVLAGSALADAPTAAEIRGPTPYLPINNEPPPKLYVDPPIESGLARGVFWVQYRVENVRIVPVFGEGALDVSPRIGHLHVTVDDSAWWWADASDSNTIDIAGLPPGEHQVKIDLVDPNHNVYPGQTKTLRFTVPEKAKPDRTASRRW